MNILLAHCWTISYSQTSSGINGFLFTFHEKILFFALVSPSIFTSRPILVIGSIEGG